MHASRFFCSMLALLAASGAAQSAAPTAAPTPAIVVAPAAPSDIPGGAPGASLQAAALFAWQEFIALNWPAKTGQRDVPDPTQKFGAAGAGPLVWHTYRSKIEIFPGTNSPLAPPPGYSAGGAPTFGYNAPPQYKYGAAVPACGGQAPVASPAWINLDEVSQIGLDTMYAGTVPAKATPVNGNPQLIRFLAKANLAEYAYVAQNQYWFDGPARQAAQANFAAAVAGAFPVKGAFINLPDGTFEIKAAFRPLTAAETASGRFYTTRVRYYEGSVTQPCYREGQWGLVGLHIIQKTPSAPAFVFATFEQADNLQAVVGGKGVAVEDEDGNIVRPSAPATTPALAYRDSTTQPTVSLVPGPACVTGSNPHLFYRNNPERTGLPGGNICVNQREHAIPAPVIAANKAAHDAIAAYSKANGVGNSPWAYYKLVNVQAYPFNKADIVGDPASPRNAATYYQANIVVETNYTLQNFDGRIAKDGAPTNFDGAKPAYQNAYVVNKDGTLVSSFNMGGCMGCHGVASRNGSNFSFLLDGSPASAPETPQATSAASLKARFNALFHRDTKK